MSQSRVTEQDAPPKKRGPGRPRLLEPSPEFVARREEIVAAAAQVFHEKGYDAGTLDDVADALDLRRASLYYYVHSKANLLFMIVEHALGIALHRLDEYAQIEDPRDRLEALIRNQVRTVAGDPGLFAVYFDHRFRLDDRYEAVVYPMERRYLDTFLAAVREAIAAGVIGDVDPRAATHSILGMTFWSYKWFHPGSDDVERLADDCVTLLLGPPARGGRRPAVAKAAPKPGTGTRRKTNR